MKFNIPAVTLCAVFSSDKMLTGAESVNIAMTATETEVKKKVKVYETKEEKPKEEIDWEERSQRLNEKLAAMADLRMKMWTRGGYVVKSKKECRPHGPEAEDKKGLDLGILFCERSGDICIEDSSSSLGGICADVVLDEVGYGDTTIHHHQGEGVVSRRPNKFSMLKPLSEGAKLKVKNILELSKDGSATGEECNPGTNEGYVEVGAANPCKYSGHVCVNDSSSTLGGTCVDIDIGHYDEQFWWSWSPPTPPPMKSQKQKCNYKDGGSGYKCAEPGWLQSMFFPLPWLFPCQGLSYDFIKNNIGCGSCNGIMACRYLTDDSSIGEKSCSTHACKGLTGFTKATLTVGDKSCTKPGSCSSLQGSVAIGSDSCYGAYACIKSSGPVTTIDSGSCNKDGACSFATGTTTIGKDSCNHCYSCSNGKDVTTIKDHSCNGPLACAYAVGKTTIQSHSCEGSGACKHLAGTSEVGKYSCRGVGACNMVASGLPSWAALTVGSDSCLGCYACNDIAGLVSISSKSCYEFSSCRYLVGTVSIGNNSCQRINACSNNAKGSTLTVGDHACNQVKWCNLFSGSVTIPGNSCNGGSRDGCGVPLSVYVSSSDTILSSSTGAKLRGGNTGNIGCLPNAQKVKVQHQLNAIEPMQVFELEVTSSGVNVAEGKPVVSSDVAATMTERMLEQVNMDMVNVWEVDLQDSFLVSSVSVLNTWCKESEDPEKCLCNLTGAKVSLIDGSGEEITSVSAGDTCGQEVVEFVFDASAEFCESTVSQVTSSKSQPAQAPTTWKKRSRALGSSPTKC